MSIPPKFSIRARGQSFNHAFRGLRFMLQTQHNAWLHAVATVTVCVVSIGFQISRIEWCLIILSVMAVWTAEAFNTALECLTDLASPDHHPLAGKAKDVAAGAVLIAAVSAAVSRGNRVHPAHVGDRRSNTISKLTAAPVIWMAGVGHTYNQRRLAHHSPIHRQLPDVHGEVCRKNVTDEIASGLQQRSFEQRQAMRHTEMFDGNSRKRVTEFCIAVVDCCKQLARVMVSLRPLFLAVKPARRLCARLSDRETACPAS